MAVKEPCHHILQEEKCIYFLESENERNRLLFHDEEHAFYPCIISFVKATKYLEKGCQGFIASVVESCMEQQKVDSSSVRVVKEYLDVFPEELPRLPPKRDLEFSIDLLTKTTLISKAPYRMAPTELKELKLQLKEMHDKGFQDLVYHHGEH